MMHRRPAEARRSQVAGPAIEVSGCEIRDFACDPTGTDIARSS